MNQKLIYALINAGIVGGIVFLSTLPTQYPPPPHAIYHAFIGAGLALLTQVKSVIEGLIGDNGNGGGRSGIEDLTKPEQEIHAQSIRKDKQRLGMLI